MSELSEALNDTNLTIDNKLALLNLSILQIESLLSAKRSMEKDTYEEEIRKIVYGHTNEESLAILKQDYDTVGSMPLGQQSETSDISVGSLTITPLKVDLNARYNHRHSYTANLSYAITGKGVFNFEMQYHLAPTYLENSASSIWYCKDNMKTMLQSTSWLSHLIGNPFRNIDMQPSITWDRLNEVWKMLSLFINAEKKAYEYIQRISMYLNTRYAIGDTIPDVFILILKFFANNTPNCVYEEDAGIVVDYSSTIDSGADTLVLVKRGSDYEKSNRNVKIYKRYNLAQQISR